MRDIVAVQRRQRRTLIRRPGRTHAGIGRHMREFLNTVRTTIRDSMRSEWWSDIRTGIRTGMRTSN